MIYLVHMPVPLYRTTENAQNITTFLVPK